MAVLSIHLVCVHKLIHVLLQNRISLNKYLEK